MKKSVYYNLKKIVDPELIIYHHLGLGDHLICNGLVNYLSLYFNKVFLPVKKEILITFLICIKKIIKFIYLKFQMKRKMS